MFVGFKLSITPRLGRKPNTNFGVDSDFTPSQLGPSGLSDSEVAESGPVVTVGRAPSPRGQSRGSGVDSGMPALRAGDAMQECSRSRSWTANTRLVERLKATDDEIARQPARVRCGDQINAIM